MSSLLKILAASSPNSGLLRPAVTVEIAFNAGYSTAASARTWTDVTAYVLLVQGLDITHGRQDERSQADANSLRLVLNNKDGRFTPGRSTSPYYPNVKLGRPIRVSVMTASGHTSVRFVGYIDEWPVEWSLVVDTFATSAITATSRHARLGSGAPLLNHIYEEYRRDDPIAHYMLDNLADSVVNGGSLVQTGSGTAVTFEATGPTDGIQAAQFASGKYLEARGMAGVLDATTTASVECFFSTTESVAPILIWDDGASPSNGFGIEMDMPTGLRWTVGGSSFHYSTTALNDGTTHHVAITANEAGNSRLYVDGTLVDTRAAGTLAGSDPYLRVGGTPFDTFAGAIAHVALYTSELSATRAANHADAGLTGSAKETAEARTARYAAFAGIPTAEQSISTAADTPMAHIDTTGQTALALLQKVAETDGGVLYDARDGTLTYAARSARYNLTAAVTLDVNAGQVEASYSPKLDRTSMINEVVATVADGSDPQETIRAVDQDSYDAYGPEQVSIELATTDADEAHAAAWWRVNTYGEPVARAPQLTVEIAHLSQAMQASVLNLNVGSKVTVTNLPSQSDASSKSFFVEGYNETIGEATHRITFNVSPTDGFNVWTLEDPTYGAYDSNPLAY